MEQHDKVVHGLTERSVGLTTSNRLGQTFLHYLGFDAGGISSHNYLALITAKLEDQHSKEGVDHFLQK